MAPLGEAHLARGELAAAVEMLRAAHDRWMLLGPLSKTDADACRRSLAEAQARLTAAAIHPLGTSRSGK